MHPATEQPLHQYTLAVNIAPVSNTVILHEAAAQQWLAFRAPVEVIEARRAAEVMPALRRIEALVNERGLYAAGFISYEASPGFDHALQVRAETARLRRQFAELCTDFFLWRQKFHSST